MLPSGERLTRRKDFSAVYAAKRSWTTSLLVLYVRRVYSSEAAETRRFGFVVSKKVGKAHDRNKVKRRLREIARLNGETWKQGFDAVFVARSAAASASYVEMEKAFEELMRRGKLVRPGEDVAGGVSVSGADSNKSKGGGVSDRECEGSGS
jgi:ribonuclease P protein component